MTLHTTHTQVESAQAKPPAIVLLTTFTFALLYTFLTHVQNPSNSLCYFQISALGALGPGAWVLGSSFMQHVYSVFDYGTPAPAAGSNGPVKTAAAAAAAAAAAVPRVGLGGLTAAEKAAARAAFDQGLASKTSSAGLYSGWSSSGPGASWQGLVVMLMMVVWLAGW